MKKEARSENLGAMRTSRLTGYPSPSRTLRLTEYGE